MSNIRILFVDDDQDLREANAALLKNAGFDVIEADSAAQALEIMGQGYDLAVVDLVMEKADSGFSLAFQLKKQAPDKPIVIISDVNDIPGLNFSVNTPAEKAWIKADAFIEKPFRFEQLKARIDQLT